MEHGGSWKLTKDGIYGRLIKTVPCLRHMEQMLHLAHLCALSADGHGLYPCNAVPGPSSATSSPVDLAPVHINNAWP